MEIIDQLLKSSLYYARLSSYDEVNEEVDSSLALIGAGVSGVIGIVAKGLKIGFVEGDTFLSLEHISNYKNGCTFYRQRRYRKR